MAPREEAYEVNPGTTPPPVADPTTTTSPPLSVHSVAELQAMITMVSLLCCARTMTNDVGRYAMTWTDLKKKMTTKYCPRNEIKKIEAEMWNLKLTKHRWKDCPQWKNKNQGNGNAVARAYAVGVAAKPIPTTDVTVPVEMGTNVRHKLHGLVEEIPGRYDCAKRSFYHGAAPVSTGTLSIGPIRKERIAIPTRAFRQSFIKSLCSITMGSFILFVKKKDGSLRDVHRLSGTKQTNSEEPLSATKN
ncbi:hypothetical protein Tco_0277272 [Tanacetum coccineum]